MPAKNTVKSYLINSHYHIYNRGVEKRDIFLDEQDCHVFLHYMKIYLLSLNELRQQLSLGLIKSRFLHLNLSEEVELICFSLMPNHIHLLIKQYTTNGIIKFMRRLTTSYVMYFNKKYDRVGSLFQGVYKATTIDSDDYLVHLSRYIHLNPSTIAHKTINFTEFSSYPYFLGSKHSTWVKPDEILSYFNDQNKMFTYRNFMEQHNSDSQEFLGPLVLEES